MLNFLLSDGPLFELWVVRGSTAFYPAEQMLLFVAFFRQARGARVTRDGRGASLALTSARLKNAKK